MLVCGMLDPGPADVGADRGLIADAVHALFDCAQICTACAGSCLGQEQLALLRTCIRTALDCADLCEATARALSRRLGYDADLTRAQLRACIEICFRCAEECERHASEHEHCRVCAEDCRRCAASCLALLTAFG
ncbi:four-helix bundle copper-binding protein [Nonomuraea sp. LPB2021202275-12-8]|uniref:four-helix bundle copper-binding protein n=1 Tax=Nonomuraea sp. LPB2021202275-12-8 TaxID=3120159 RepID=UPI00300CE90E